MTVQAEIQAELARARSKFPDLRNGHEAHSVILEEFEEFWDEVKGDHPMMARAELIQVGAMVLRALEDVYKEDVYKEESR